MVGIIRSALPISLNHCEKGLSSQQAEKAQPADKNKLIPPVFQGAVQAGHLPGSVPGLIHRLLTM